MALAAASPRARSLQQLAVRLQSLQERATGKARSAREEATSGGRPSGSKVGEEAAPLSWVRLSPAEAARLKPGQRVRISTASSAATAVRRTAGIGVAMRRGAAGGDGEEEAEVLDVLEAAASEAAGHISGGATASSPKRIHRLRVLRGGGLRYCDLGDTGWSVAALLPAAAGTPGAVSAAAEAGSSKERGREKQRGEPWPECVEQGVTLRGTGGAALFVNLKSLGISQGCFRDDCSHSDHFAADSPAVCSRTCASLRACRFWTFWQAHSGSVCWLRRNDQHRAPMLTGASGASDCVPPAGAHAPQGLTRGTKLAEPTLLELALRGFGERGGQASAFDPEHPLHQWDLVKVLKEYGEKTPSQLQALEPSPLQRSALQFARRAQRLTRSQASRSGSE
eukprot:TRINITY_DN10299_c1_g2_i2.p1 TRINITY_DN10299_c1_g2~~TRINITY_DN10299_c1_g2_i2.p1  ORF type:complete len:395 (+),score=96.05 TRINITY_DN10299_c1_g2_i2:537-1721(+)